MHVVSLGAKQEWPKPKLLTARKVKVPPFPVEILTPKMQKYCQEVATELQMPFDAVAMMALAMVAIALQRNYQIHLRGMWVEMCCIFVCCVLASGEGKTPTLNAVKRPLCDWEIAQAEKAENLINAWKAAVEDATRRSRGQGDAAEAARQELRNLKQQEPISPRLLTRNITEEAMGHVMGKYGGATALVSPEGKGPFSIVGGKYTANEASADLYCSAYSGEMYTVDRISRESLLIEKPRLTMAVFSQEMAVQQVLSNRQLSDMGFLARFFWCMPESLVGGRVPNPPVASQASKDWWHELLTRLLDQESQDSGTPQGPGMLGDEETTTCDEPLDHHHKNQEALRTLTVSAEALAVLDDLFAVIEPQLGAGKRFEHMRDSMNKARGGAARISALLHAINHRDFADRPIAVAEAQAAVKLIHYLVAHGDAVQRLGGDDIAQDLQVAARWIKSRPPRKTSFSASELRTANRKVWRHHSECESALAELVELGWLRVVNDGRARQASVVYSINPMLRDLKG